MRKIREHKGMTLVEVMVSSMVLSICFLGVLGTLLASRRITENNIMQATANTIATGYMEQLRSIDLASLCNYDTNGNPQLTTSYTIPTLFPQPDATVNSEATADPLQVSVGAIPAMSSLTPGVTPGGVVDNLKSFDMTKNISALNFDNVDTSSGSIKSTTAFSTWSVLWPNARNYPASGTGTTTVVNSSGQTVTVKNPTPVTTTPGVVDLHMNIWVWITDLTNAGQKANKVYGITMIYTWQFRDGTSVRYAINSLRQIRSTAPTY